MCVEVKAAIKTWEKSQEILFISDLDFEDRKYIGIIFSTKVEMPEY